MKRCIVCGRRLWFSRTGHRSLPGGLVVRWHASHTRRVTFDDAALRALGEDIVAYIVEPRP